MASKKLTDKQIKKIISERAEGASYNSLSKKYKVSANTIKNYCLGNADFAQICTQKKEDNSKSVLSHMENKTDIVCEIVDKYLEALADPERLAERGPKEIATALGIVIDKFTKVGNNDDLNKLDKVLGKIEGNI